MNPFVLLLTCEVGVEYVGCYANQQEAAKALATLYFWELHSTPARMSEAQICQVSWEEVRSLEASYAILASTPGNQLN